MFLVNGAYFKAWFSSALTIIGATFYGVIGLFPNLFPSSLDPKYSLTAFNSSSSPLTVVIIFIPIVLAYQIWAYNVFKDKVVEEELTRS